MTTASITPAQLLASDPVRERRAKTKWSKEADRTVTFRWVVARGVADEFGNPRDIVAALSCTHNKRDRRPANYSATLWREAHGERSISVTFDGRNGLRVTEQAEGAARYSEARFLAFAENALSELRELADRDDVLVYFDPSRKP